MRRLDAALREKTMAVLIFGVLLFLYSLVALPGWA